MSQTPCACSDEDRTMTGTWCTPELQTAIRLGYKVLKMYEVYHWETTTQYNPENKEEGLFATSTHSSSINRKPVDIRTGSRPLMTLRSTSICTLKRKGCV